jgi:hypothetical protein
MLLVTLFLAKGLGLMNQEIKAKYLSNKCKSMLLLFPLLLALSLTIFIEVPASTGTDSSTMRSAQVISVTGEVKVKKSGGEKAYPAIKGMGLVHGDGIITKKKALTFLEMDNDKEIRIGSSTQIIVSELITSVKTMGKKTSISLLSGKVLITISKKLENDSKFEIRTPTVIMGVRGTQFYTSYLDNKLYLAVIEGTVNMTVINTGQNIDIPPYSMVVIDSFAPNNSQIIVSKIDFNALDLFALEGIRDGGRVDKATLDLINTLIEKKILEQSSSLPLSTSSSSVDKTPLSSPGQGTIPVIIYKLSDIPAGIKITAPLKTSYWIGEALDLKGLKVTITSKSGKSSTVAGYSLSGFDSISSGAKEIIVNYKGKTASFTINVSDPLVTAISINTPAKLTYWLGESLDLKGLVVTATYNHGNPETVTGYAVSGFDSTSPGTKEIIVNYKGKTAAFKINITAPVVTAISINTPDKLTYWLGESLDLKGLVVTATYNHGNPETVTGYAVSGFDSTTTGTETIIINYNNQTASFNVTVNQLQPPAPKTISILSIIGITPPAKGATPNYTITETSQFTGTITWSPPIIAGNIGLVAVAPTPVFAPLTSYTATITITPKQGYTLSGVPANFFVVAGATSVSNSPGSGIVTALFPQTSR